MRSIPAILAGHPKLRLARPDDAKAVLDIYGPLIRTSPITFEIEVPSVLEMADRIRTIQQKYPWLVYEIEGQVVGYAYASDHRTRAAYRWTAEISAYVSEKYHRKGIAKDLYRCLFELLRVQNYQYLLAGITLPNEASVALHESMGMKPLGVYHGIGFKQGKWHDVGWWEIPSRRELRAGGTVTFRIPALSMMQKQMMASAEKLEVVDGIGAAFRYGDDVVDVEERAGFAVLVLAGALIAEVDCLDDLLQEGLPDGTPQLRLGCGCHRRLFLSRLDVAADFALGSSFFLACGYPHGVIFLDVEFNRGLENVFKRGYLSVFLRDDFFRTLDFLFEENFKHSSLTLPF